MARTKRKNNPLQPEAAASAPAERVYRTAGYARLSIEDGNRPGSDTLDGQEKLVTEYIKSNPAFAFAGLWADNGHTGTDFERPQFEALMEAVKRGEIDCIVCKDLSRFGRNYKETGNYLERIFPFLGVRFIAINDNFDTLTAERSADGYISVLLNIVNEMYSKDLSAKLGATFATKQKNGDYIGAAPPYGYRKCADNINRLEPDPETAPVVQRIFAMKKSGVSSQIIARTLNAEGVFAPGRLHCMRTGRKDKRIENSIWEYQRIYNMLRDPVYLGHVAQGRSRQSFNRNEPKRNQKREDWVIVENTHEPLVDAETFQAVQVMKTERKTHPDPAPENLLLGLIFCADCGCSLSRNKVTSRYGCVNHSYVCHTHLNEPTRCSKKYINEKELFPILLTAIQKQIAVAVRMDELVRRLNSSSQYTAQRDSRERSRVKAAAALSRKQALCDSLYQNYAEKLLSEGEYTELKSRYQVEIQELGVALRQLDAECATAKEVTPENRFLTAFRQFTGATAFTRDMAVSLIQRVEIGADKSVGIIFRYKDEYETLAGYIEKAVQND